MSLDPKNLFIGVVDFFSVLLPGALLTLLIQESENEFLNGLYSGLNGIPTWVALLFIAYVLGHLIFLGGALLDRSLYDPIRDSTSAREVDRLTRDVDPPSALDQFLAPAIRYMSPAKRRLARWLVNKDADNALDQTILIKEHYVKKLGPRPGINAFQWCKARLALENRTEALATVQRFEADSKFFRSFAVVIFILFFWKLYDREYALALVSLVFVIPALWRYFDQRLKATNQAYWYIITMEAANPTGYRPAPSRAGGVVHRTNEDSEIEYLVVQAKDGPGDWVLPKGHIEQGEGARAAAVREVCEETGVFGRIKDDLGTTSFELADEHVEVQFYLMVASGSCERQEERATRWLPIEGAFGSITHKESKKMLLRAELRLNPNRDLAAAIGMDGPLIADKARGPSIGREPRSRRRSIREES
jgi:8-oxo-dGTP pyrophosphatase MutT (NUDIX family)